MRSGIIIIAFYALLAAIAFILQWIPFTGIFLMILGGALIIGALVHFCLLHLAFFAIWGRISRVWLVLPLMYYGGGFYLHLISVRQVAQVASAIEKVNAEQHVQARTPFTYFSAGLETLELLQRFKIDAAYSKERSEAGHEYGRYSYAKGTDCEKGNAGFYYAQRYTQAFLWRRELFPSYRETDKTSQCILLQTVTEAHLDYDVREAPDNVGSTFLYRQFIQKWTARDLKTDQVVASVKVGSLTPLPIVQFIIAGCVLNSGAPSWDCNANLMSGFDVVAVGYKKRTDNGNPFIPVVDVETSSAAALGHALGLAPRTPTD